MRRIWVGSCLVSLLAAGSIAYSSIGSATATSAGHSDGQMAHVRSEAPARPSDVPRLHLAKPTRLLFHAFSGGRGYFEQARLSGNGKARLLFRHQNEPFVAVGTHTHIVWINEPDRFSKTAILIATDTGHNQHVLVHHVPNAENLVLAGRYVYWDGLHWVGRIRLDGSHMTRRFIRLPSESGGGVADGMTTDGQYLYFTQCEGRIGKVPIATASSGGAVTWLVVDPSDRNFCAQSVAWSGKYLFYSDDSGIGRIGVNGSGRNDHWRRVPSAAESTLVADQRHLYWDTCAGSSCSRSHIAMMATTGHHLRHGLYDDIDQGLTLAP
jgi:hypothetical protein